MRLRIRQNLLICVPLLLSVAVWLPLAFLVSGSLSGKQEISELLGSALISGKEGYADWHLLPQYPTLRSYVELLLDSPEFFVMFWNSLWLTAGSLVGQLLVALPAAWWFARAGTRLGRWLFTAYIILMIMPFQVTMVSNYFVLNAAGLLDTHWSIVLPMTFSTFPVYIMYRFFKAIPQSMIEAAQIDGASNFQIFFHIGLPLGKAGIASAMVLGFLEYWNLIEQPMTFLKTKSRWPLSLFLPEVSAANLGILFAASVIILFPSILVFLFGQEYLEKGLAGSGVKE